MQDNAPRFSAAGTQLNRRKWRSDAILRPVNDLRQCGPGKRRLTQEMIAMYSIVTYGSFLTWIRDAAAQKAGKGATARKPVPP